MKVVKAQTGDSQVAVSCLGGCLLLIGWVVVGIINVGLISQFKLKPWEATIFGIVWLLSAPVGGFAYLKWRGLRHKKAFRVLEAKMNEKALDRLRKQSPDP